MTQTPKPPQLIHIYHKTASSFLQARVFTDRRLFSQPWGGQSAKALDWFILTHPLRFLPEKVRADFEAARGPKDDTVPVISHEALSGQPNGGRYYANRVVDRLHQAFPEARILIGIREQRNLLVSLYYQHIRKGGTSSVIEFLQPLENRPDFPPKVWLPHFEYDLMLELYRSRWKNGDILVLPQKLLKADHADYLHRLLDFAGLPHTEIATYASVNARRANVTIRLERFFNRFIKAPNPRPERSRDYPWIYRTKSRMLQGLERIGPVRRPGAAEDARIKAHP